MALQKCELNLNGASRELHPHGSIGFPCAGYSGSYSDNPEEALPWHWHEEMELLYVAEGRLTLRTPAASLLLCRGQMAAVNSKVLHSAAGAPKCTLHSLVFSPSLISGGEESAIAKKYIRPLMACPAFTGFKIPPEDNPEVSGWFKQAFEAIKNDSRGCEFTVRESLSRICLYLCEEFDAKMSKRPRIFARDSIRIRQMLDFIHDSFGDPISVEDIAAAANIGEVESLRCFRKLLQTSPKQYLIKYRVMRGAEMMAEDPEITVYEVAERCGFDSSSNFGKAFKRFYNCTPREYRKGLNANSL